MTLYPFEDLETGQSVDLDFAMDDAPRIGDVIEHKGRIYRRLPTLFHREPEWDCRHVCHQLTSDKRDPENGYEFPHYDKDGKGAFTTRREIEEFQAKHPTLHYDG